MKIEIKNMEWLLLFNNKSVTIAYSPQGRHTGQLDFCN
jgi:hypothetical protein